MAGKEGSAAGLMRDQARLLAALLAREIATFAADATIEAATRAEKISRSVKLAADAGKSVVALEAAAEKALAPGASTSSCAPATDGEGDADSEEMDMDDDDNAVFDPQEIDQLRDRLERRIAELLGGDERKHAGPGLRTGGPGEPLAHPLGLGGVSAADAA